MVLIFVVYAQDALNADAIADHCVRTAKTLYALVTLTGFVPCLCLCLCECMHTSGCHTLALMITVLVS